MTRLKPLLFVITSASIALAAAGAGGAASPQGKSHQGGTNPATQESKVSPEIFQAFEFADLVAKRKKAKRGYLPFLANETLMCGVYHLPKGAVDGQSPHAQDELYYVVEGRGKFRCEEATVEVKPGSVLFVQAHARHRFFDIEEDLEILVFFSKAKTGAKPKKATEGGDK